jgi:hypothetical protein
VQSLAQGTAGPGPPRPDAAAEWEALHARLRVYLNALADAQPDADMSRLSMLCREGVALLTEMEAFTRRATSPDPTALAAPPAR